MIFTLPLTLIFFFIRGLLGVLPTAGLLPVIIEDSFVLLWGLMWQLDFVVSVPLIGQLLSYTLVMELAIQVWHGIHWLIKKIPILHIR